MFHVRCVCAHTELTGSRTSNWSDSGIVIVLPISLTPLTIQGRSLCICAQANISLWLPNDCTSLGIAYTDWMLDSRFYEQMDLTLVSFPFTPQQRPLQTVSIQFLGPYNAGTH